MGVSKIPDSTDLGPEKNTGDQVFATEINGRNDAIVENATAIGLSTDEADPDPGASHEARIKDLVAEALQNSDLSGSHTGTIIRTGVGTYEVARENLDAVVDPTVNDDVTLGYQPGSVWIRPGTSSAWVCTDNTDGAAVWQAL